MTDFNITRNVLEDFSLTIPDFTEHPTLTARISSVTGMSFQHSMGMDEILNTSLSVPMVLLTPHMVIAPPPTTTISGATGGGGSPYSTSAGDCWLCIGLDYSFSNTGNFLKIGGKYGSHGYMTWIPFVVTMSTQTIVSATLNLKASADYTPPPYETIGLKIGCENVLNANTPPTTYDMLMARPMTSNFTTIDVEPNWVAGTTYHYDVTSAVQEILNKAGWTSGYTLAIIITTYNTLDDRHEKQAWAFENTLDYATLNISV